ISPIRSNRVMEQLKNPGLGSLAIISISFLASMLTMMAIFPDLLVWHKMSFMWQHDTEIPFENTFTLVSQYYHGGIQLWNPYDQMSYAFSHTTSGLYTLANLMTASAYILLRRFFNHPGEAFHGIYSIGFFSFNTLIRTLGGYLLLREFCVSPLA